MMTTMAAILGAVPLMVVLKRRWRGCCTWLGSGMQV